jgi:multidrug efflux pump subunit AcrA (membrane-fusion protein)
VTEQPRDEETNEGPRVMGTPTEHSEVTACAVCVACEHGSDDSLASLVRRQAVTIDRLRSNLDTFRLAAAQMRIRELEETVQRLNVTRPRQMATEVASELAQMDPRDPDLTCLFCFERIGPNEPTRGHRKDCAWKRAQVVVEVLERDRRKAAS